ncbi:MAG TPA: DUF2804 domain-containing protein, partial [Anaerolineaceae bacterium]|nr:DUF2804 domain-containing protein [Anaerolineaceae bacterium]
MSPHKIIDTHGPLLLPDGSLAQIGWSTQPMLDSNLENTRTTPLRFLQRLRLKRWDYYGLTTPEYFFSFTLADIGYAGSVFAYAINSETGACEEATLTLPFGRGVELPRNSTKGISRFKNDQVEMVFEVKPSVRTLKVNWKAFGGAGKPDFCADVRFAAAPKHESMNLVIPIRGKRYYFNRKINCLPASGSVEYGGKAFAISPDTCLGNLDWGRGVWEFNSYWVWASASGFLPGGRTLGLNMGYGFGESHAPSEHAVILDGKIVKFDRVDFTFDSQHYKNPWRMVSPDGRLDLTFT